MHKKANHQTTRKKLTSSSEAGFQLLEIMIALAIVGLLAAISAPSYQEFMEDADNSQAATDIADIASKIEIYYIVNNGYPANLAAAGISGLTDPWGNAYQYLPIDGANPPQGKLRKDKNLVPINSDFDLYSSGKDGNSQGPLTSNASKDDIVRASNGRYIGIAKDY